MSTREAIRGFIAGTLLDGADAAALRDDTSLEGAHVVDSARVLEVILFLEETFGITVEPDDAVPENFDSVDALVAYVDRKRASDPPSHAGPSGRSVEVSAAER